MSKKDGVTGKRMLPDNQQHRSKNTQPNPAAATEYVPPKVVVGHFGETNPAVPPKESLRQPAQQLPPQPNQDPYIGLTGSRMQPEKQRLPNGIYIIVTLLFLSIITSLFDSSQASMLYTVSMLVNLVLGVGLLFRLEAARKVLAVFSAILVVLYAIILVFSFALEQRVNQSVANYNAVVENIDERKLTSSQKAQLKNWEVQIADAHKRVGKEFTFMYIRTSAYIVLMLAVVVYLGRPKVKSVFVRMS